MPCKRDSAIPKKMPRKRTAGEADLEDGHGKGPMASSVHGSWQGSWEQCLAQSRQQGSWHRKMADLEDGYGTGQLRAMASSVKAAAKPIWKMAVAIGQSMAMASSDDANGEGQGSGEADLEDGYGKGREWPWQSSVGQGSGEADLEDGHSKGREWPRQSSVGQGSGEADPEDGHSNGQWMAMASSVGQGSGEANLEDGYGKGQKMAMGNGGCKQCACCGEAVLLSQRNCYHCGAYTAVTAPQGSGEADLEDKSSLPPGYYIPGIYVSGDYIPRTPEWPGFESPRDPRSRTPELEGSVGGKGKDVARMSEVSQHLQQQQEQHQ